MVGPETTLARTAVRLTAAALIVLALVVGRRGARADDAGTDAAAAMLGAPIDAGVPDAPVDADVDAAAPPLDAAAPPLDAAAPPLDAAAPPLDAAAPPLVVGLQAVVDAGPAAHEPAPPILDAPPPASTSPARTTGVIKLVLGLSAVFVLAYIGGHRKVVALETRLGISGVIAAGFPMIALGLVLRQPAIGILTDDVLGRLQPILHFGLGWLGFIIGAQLDIRVLDRVPRGTAYVVFVEALGPFAATAAACAGLALALDLADWRQPEFWRDAIILGTAAAMTAPRRFRGFARQTWREGMGVDHLITQLDEIVGVIGLLFIAAFFRTVDSGAWQLPGTAWLFVTIGLGVVVGVIFFVMIRVPSSRGELLAVVLGSVAFGSGLAGYLELSPIVICFLAGALVTNFPSERKRDVFAILTHLERPINLLFLVLAGAAWAATEPAPWLVVPAFAAARVLGKWLAVTGAERTIAVRLPDGFAAQRTLLSPLSPLSLALVLSLQGSAGGAPSPWLLTVVIGGALLTELAVQLTAPPAPRASTRPPAPAPTGPIDELDDHDHDHDDPVYRDDEPDGGTPPPGLPPGGAP
jgi:Kef-type K+ transport system membrane component KefB